MSGAAAEMPVIPPKDPNEDPDQVSIRTSLGRVAEMDLIATREKRSRNEIADYLWDWGLAQHWREKGEERPKDPLKVLKAELGPKAFAEWMVKRKGKG